MEMPSYLKSIAKTSKQFEDELMSVFLSKEYLKGEFLFEQGKICNHVFYIEKGFLRVFYYSESGREITAWFSADNTFITAIDSFYYHKPTRDNCELLENSVVYSLKYSDLEKLLVKEEGARLAFHVLYEITRKMIEFVVSLKFQSAEEKYHTLLKNYPDIIQRASLGHIASYLGITQETLSRIRAVK